MRPLLIISLLGCFIAACGGGDSISADEADRIASELAQKSQALSGEVADAGRALVEDPDRADERRDRLGDLENQAQDLAARAEDLPESTEARKQLREANERIADAAGDLADADPDDRDEALEKASGRIEQARGRIREAADRIADALPPDSRKDLDALRERLSSPTP